MFTWPRPVAGCLLVLSAGCLRVVTPQGASDAAVPIHVDVVELQPARGELQCAGGAPGLAGFADDVLHVRGGGWDPENRELRVGERVLSVTRATDTDLYAALPDALPVGKVRVTSPGRGGTTVETSVCTVGPGHLRRMTFAGDIDPQLSMGAAGTARMECRDELFPDGGPADSGYRCEAFNTPGATFAAVFNWGLAPTFSGDTDQYVARASLMEFDTQLQHWPGRDGGFTRLITSVAPLSARADGGVPVAAIEVHRDTPGSVAVEMSLFGDVVRHGSMVQPVLTRVGRDNWLWAESIPGVEGRLTMFRGDRPADTLGTWTLAPRPLATAVLYPGWDRFAAKVGGPEFLEVSCNRGPEPFTFEMGVHRVFLERPAMPVVSVSRLIGRPSLCLTPGCRALLDCHGNKTCLLASAADDPTSRPALECRADATCGSAAACYEDRATCWPATSLPAPCPDARCRDARLAELATGNELARRWAAFKRCWDDPGCHGTIDCRWTGGDALACGRAAECALDPVCADQATCASLEQGGCALRYRCAEALCGNPENPPVMTLLPVTQDLAVFSQQRMGDPFERRAYPFCALETSTNGLVGIDAFVPAVSAIATTQEPGSDDTRRILFVPADIDEVWSLSVLTRELLRVPAPTRYRQLVSDPFPGLVYGIPESGGRVDVLNADGERTSSVSVLGSARQAWPLSREDGRIVVLFPNGPIAMGRSGDVLRYAAPSPMPERVALDLDRQGRPVGAVSARRPDADGGMQEVSELDVDPDSPTFGTSTVLARIDGAGDLAVVACGPEVVVLAEGTESTGVARLRRFTDGGVAALERIAGAEDVAVLGYNASTGVLYAMQEVDGGRLTREIVVTGDEPGVTDAGHEPAMQLVPVPGGGAIGLFFNIERARFELGAIDATGYHALGDPVFLGDNIPAVSPDGQRLYVGLEGAILELSISRADGGALSTSLLRRIAVDGTPFQLRTDPYGSRLVYVDPMAQVVGLVEE